VFSSQGLSILSGVQAAGLSASGAEGDAAVGGAVAGAGTAKLTLKLKLKLGSKAGTAEAEAEAARRMWDVVAAGGGHAGHAVQAAAGAQQKWLAVLQVSFARWTLRARWVTLAG
jgi:hypothetical protein